MRGSAAGLIRVQTQTTDGWIEMDSKVTFSLFPLRTYWLPSAFLSLPLFFPLPFLLHPPPLPARQIPWSCCNFRQFAERRAAGLLPAAESASDVVWRYGGGASIGSREETVVGVVGEGWCLRSGDECKSYFHFLLMTRMGVLRLVSVSKRQTRVQQQTC